MDREYFWPPSYRQSILSVVFPVIYDVFIDIWNLSYSDQLVLAYPLRFAGSSFRHPNRTDLVRT